MSPMKPRMLLFSLITCLIAADAASAGDLLDPSAFASSGVLDLTSGAYVIDTSGGPGGVPVLMVQGGATLASGSTYSQGGYAFSGGTFDPTVGVLDFSSVTIGTGVTITIIGANPLALLSRGFETIDGHILANGAAGLTGSQGGASGAGGPGGAAGGKGGAFYVGNGVAGSGPGGGQTPCGGPAICSDGQDGGYGGGGINGPFTNLSPTYGDLETYPLGGSGGSGAGVAIFAQEGPGGGGGGGAVEFRAATGITFGPSSLVQANGGPGGSGPYYGGAGSGGGLIFAAPNIGADPFDGIQALGGGGGRVLFVDASGAVPGVSVDVDGGAFGDVAGTVDFEKLEAAAPEPTAWAMLTAGLGLAGGAIRRRRGEHGFTPAPPA